MPQPFNLSRSNSRRTKEVLFKEKVEKDKKMIEEEEKLQKENKPKPKDIPISNYVPDMMAYRSTKNLTNFRDFNFGPSNLYNSNTLNSSHSTISSNFYSSHVS